MYLHTDSRPTDPSKRPLRLSPRDLHVHLISEALAIWMALAGEIGAGVAVLLCFVGLLRFGEALSVVSWVRVGEIAAVLLF